MKNFDIRAELLNSVKIATSKYGISGISTRNISDIAKVCDTNIYRFFHSKDALLLEAYSYENGIIFDAILNELDNAKGSSDIEESSKIGFKKVWDLILSDHDRLNFCVSFFHSGYFKMASNYHNNQLDDLCDRLGKYFSDKNDCIYVMYMLCSVLYDSAYSVVLGLAENSPEYESKILRSISALFNAFADKI